MVVLVARHRRRSTSTAQFHGNWLLVASLAIGLVGFYCMHTTRGTLSGNGRLPARTARCSRPKASSGSSARSCSGDSASTTPARTACAWRSRRSSRSRCRCASASKLLEPGPAGAVLRALQRARLAARRLGAHAAARLLVAARRQRAEGRASNVGSSPRSPRAFFVARIPPLLFQAVQGTLLPKLAGPRRRGPPRRLPHRAQAAAGHRRAGSPSSARSPRSRSACRVGKILFPPFDIDSARPRAARRRAAACSSSP